MGYGEFVALWCFFEDGWVCDFLERIVVGR